MPPKVNKNSKKNKKKNNSIDDVDTTTLNRTKLEEFCQNVNHELNEEITYSEYLRMDRDKLASMIAISGEHLKLTQEKIRELNNEIRDSEESHRMAMEQNKQKTKHVINEFENKYSDLKTNVTYNIIRTERQNHREAAAEIIFDINEHKKQNLQVQDDFSSIKVKIEKQHAENIYTIRDKNKHDHVLTEIQREKNINKETAQLKSVHNSNYKSLLCLKEKHYHYFLDINDKKTTYLKFYYNRIVNQNKEVIQLIKNEIKKVRESMGKLDTQYMTFKEENQRLSEEICALDREKSALAKELCSSKKHKKELHRTKEELQTRKRLLQDLEIEDYIQVLIDEKKDDIQKQEDAKSSHMLLNSVSKTQSIMFVKEIFILHIFNKISEINTVLDKIKVKHEKQEGLNNRFYEAVYKDNAHIPDSVNYEIAEMEEKRNNLLLTYKKVLKKFKIPFQNTGFKPLSFNEILAQADNPQMLVTEDMIINPTPKRKIYQSKYNRLRT